MNEPTLSDTPETDAKAIRHCANWSNCGDHVREIVFADFARNLERQRNEARAQRDALRQALRGLNKLNLCGRAYEEIETALATLDLKP